jgi:hypothetical protein
MCMGAFLILPLSPGFSPVPRSFPTGTAVTTTVRECLKTRAYSHFERCTRTRRAARGRAEGLTLITLARSAAPFLAVPEGVV